MKSIRTWKGLPPLLNPSKQKRRVSFSENVDNLSEKTSESVNNNIDTVKDGKRTPEVFLNDREDPSSGSSRDHNKSRSKRRRRRVSFNDNVDTLPDIASERVNSKANNTNRSNGSPEELLNDRKDTPSGSSNDLDRYPSERLKSQPLDSVKFVEPKYGMTPNEEDGFGGGEGSTLAAPTMKHGFIMPTIKITFVDEDLEEFYGDDYDDLMHDHWGDNSPKYSDDDYPNNHNLGILEHDPTREMESARPRKRKEDENRRKEEREKKKTLAEERRQQRIENLRKKRQTEEEMKKRKAQERETQLEEEKQKQEKENAKEDEKRQRDETEGNSDSEGEQ
ncbi:hypothetical protein SK128_016662, partial [Halocaridina rubra]